MRVTLKKAHVFESALMEAAKGVRRPTVARLSVLDEGLASVADQKAFRPEKVATELNRNVGDAVASATRAMAFVEAAYRIRGAASRVRRTTSVDDLLLEKASIEARLRVLGGVEPNDARATLLGRQKPEVRRDVEVIALDAARSLELVKANMAKAEKSTTDAVEIDLSGAIEERIVPMRNALKRRVVEIGEELVALNHQNHVELVEDDIALLREIGAID